MAFSYAFIDFGCPPGSEKDATLELASAFLLFEISMIFESKSRGAGEGPAAEGVPPESSYRRELGCYPITACSPSARGAPNLKGYALCRRPTVKVQVATCRSCSFGSERGTRMRCLEAEKFEF